MSQPNILKCLRKLLVICWKIREQRIAVIFKNLMQDLACIILRCNSCLIDYLMRIHNLENASSTSCFSTRNKQHI